MFICFGGIFVSRLVQKLCLAFFCVYHNVCCQGGGGGVGFQHHRLLSHRVQKIKGPKSAKKQWKRGSAGNDMGV